MQVQVSGKQVDVGEALGSRISQELEDGIGKYFERGAQDAEVVVSKDGYGFKVDCWVRLASGDVLTGRSVVVATEGTAAAGLLGLKGHRAVGGMRASIYNAMPLEGVQALVAYLKDFAQRHG